MASLVFPSFSFKTKRSFPFLPPYPFPCSPWASLFSSPYGWPLVCFSFPLIFLSLLDPVFHFCKTPFVCNFSLGIAISTPVVAFKFTSLSMLPILPFSPSNSHRDLPILSNSACPTSPWSGYLWPLHSPLLRPYFACRNSSLIVHRYYRYRSLFLLKSITPHAPFTVHHIPLFLPSSVLFRSPSPFYLTLHVLSPFNWVPVLFLLVFLVSICLRFKRKYSIPFSSTCLLITTYTKVHVSTNKYPALPLSLANIHSTSSA
jgi:hypothetical protein